MLRFDLLDQLGELGLQCGSVFVALDFGQRVFRLFEVPGIDKYSRVGLIKAGIA
jgi:hypothetical protein